jgi:hypothetical protein
VQFLLDHGVFSVDKISGNPTKRLKTLTIGNKNNPMESNKNECPEVFDNIL